MNNASLIKFKAKCPFCAGSLYCNSPKEELFIRECSVCGNHITADFKKKVIRKATKKERTELRKIDIRLLKQANMEGDN